MKAVIFDMDGLLLDSERLSIDALISAGRAFGYELPYAFCRSMVGVHAEGCRKLVAETYGEGFPLEAFFRLEEAHLREMVDTGRLMLKRGVEPILDYLEQQGLPRAIATSSNRARADHHLRVAGLFERFDAIVTRDDVTHGKPHPEPYLTAAARLGIAPEDCLALEDSHSGARAAHAAGIRVIVIPDLLEPNEEIRGKATAIMEDLHGALTYIQQANGVPASRR